MDRVHTRPQEATETHRGRCRITITGGKQGTAEEGKRICQRCRIRQKDEKHKDFNDLLHDGFTHYSCDVQWREQSGVTVGKRPHVLGVSPLCWCPASKTHCDTSSARPVQALTLSRADSSVHCRLSFALLLPQ